MGEYCRAGVFKRETCSIDYGVYRYIGSYISGEYVPKLLERVI